MTCEPVWPCPRLVSSTPQAFAEATHGVETSYSVWRALNPELDVPVLLPGCPGDGVPDALLAAIEDAVAAEDAPLRGLLYVHSGMAPQDRNPMLVFLLHVLEKAGYEGLETMSLRVPPGAPMPSEAMSLAAVLPSGGCLSLLIHDRINRLGRPGDIRDDGFALWAVTASAACTPVPPNHEPERNEDV